MMHPTSLPRLALALLLMVPRLLAGQPATFLRSLGSVAEDRERLAQLGGTSTEGALLRRGSEVASPSEGWRLIRPELRLTYQSELPALENDGALWSGRGLNALLRGGMTVSRGRWRVTLAPEAVLSANRPFEARSSTVDGWSPMASPWRTTEAPADLPIRFGDRPMTMILPGQSSASVRFSSITVDMTSGNLWWGPGIRNALVLSDHAPGIPRVALRSTEPWRTVLGTIEGEWFVGGLTESLFFDDDRTNDLRSASGMAVTLAPRGVRGLTVGAGRVVLASVRRADAIAGHALDVWRTWDGAPDRDQMSSAFFRWVRPEAGVEVWGEYARQRLPSTWREALTAPNADMGWTAGAQWALHRPDGLLRLQTEFSDVAQSRVSASRAPRDWGTGQYVTQGFTQRGQLLGPAIGPGGTHAWVAVDRLRSDWSIGGFAARTRWENDAYYREGILSFFGHDVSLLGGVRWQSRGTAHDVGMSIGWERRFNYQFENGTINPNNRGQRTYDNVRWTLSLIPR